MCFMESQLLADDSVLESFAARPNVMTGECDCLRFYDLRFHLIILQFLQPTRLNFYLIFVFKNENKIYMFIH